MDLVRTLVREAHRRFLWQVSSVYRHLAENIQNNFTVSLLSRPQAWEAVGRLSHEIGDVDGALEGYRAFGELWADADPELQPRVQEANVRMQVLQGAMDR